MAGGAVTETVGNETRNTGILVRSGTLAGGVNADFAQQFQPRVGDFDVWAVPFVNQPRSNAATVGLFDGLSSQVWELDLASGVADPIYSTNDVITSAMVIPSSGALYFIAAKHDGRPQGVFALTEPEDSPTRLLEPVGTWGERAPGEFDRLLVTSDERFVIQLACTGEACRVRWLDLRDRTTTELDGLGHGVVVGLADRVLYFSGLPATDSCNLNCPVLAIRLDDGGTSLVGELCQDEAAITSRGGVGRLVTAMSEVCGADSYGVSTADPLTGASAEVSVPAGSRLPPSTGAGDVSIEPLEDAWLMVSEGRDIAWLVDATGRRVEFQPTLD